MSELIGTAGLWAAAIAALLLTLLRGPINADAAARDQTAGLFVLGLAAPKPDHFSMGRGHRRAALATAESTDELTHC